MVREQGGGTGVSTVSPEATGDLSAHCPQVSYICWRVFTSAKHSGNVHQTLLSRYLREELKAEDGGGEPP